MSACQACATALVPNVARDLGVFLQGSPLRQQLAAGACPRSRNMTAPPIVKELILIHTMACIPQARSCAFARIKTMHEATAVIQRGPQLQRQCTCVSVCVCVCVCVCVRVCLCVQCRPTQKCCRNPGTIAPASALLKKPGASPSLPHQSSRKIQAFLPLRPGSLHSNVAMSMHVRMRLACKSRCTRRVPGGIRV